ncbi:MAG: hypothetical protein DCC58_14410 [Chloroflexi bacterium]|nr:MAG: hypothetical protein DCC58_14410 [Chloroflexota bacterium]
MIPVARVHSHATSLPALLVSAVGVVAIVLLAHVAPPAYVALLLAAIGAGLLVLRHPWLAGVLLVASVPVQQVGAVGAGGASLTATRICLLVALAAAIIRWSALAQPVILHRGLALYACFLLVLLLSVHGATNVSAGISELARWCIAFVAFGCFLQWCDPARPMHVVMLAGAVVAATAAEALYGLFQSVRAVGPESFVIGGGVTRAFGTFGRPNTFAGFLEFGPFLAAALGLYFAMRTTTALRLYRQIRLQGFVAATPARRRLFWLVALMVAFFASGSLAFLGIVASFSRGAWVGVAGGILAFALLYGPRTRLLTLLAIPLVIVVVASGLLARLPGSLEERVVSISDVARPFDASSIPITDENFAAVERMAHWQAGWRMFKDHPILGVGPGNFNTLYPSYYVREEFRFSQGHAHNYYIHLLAETGILGLVAYLTLLGFFLFLGLRIVIACVEPLPRAIALGCTVTLVSLSIHNLFENLHVLNLSIMYSSLFCLLVASHRMWRGSGTSACFAAGENVEYSANEHS